MLQLEFSIILLYVSVFGFSDYIVKTFQLKKEKYLMFYVFLLLLGLTGVYYHRKKESLSECNQTA